MIGRLFAAAALAVLTAAVTDTAQAALLTKAEQWAARGFCAEQKSEPSVVVKVEWRDANTSLDLKVRGDVSWSEYYRYKGDSGFHTFDEALFRDKSRLAVSCRRNWFGDKLKIDSSVVRQDDSHSIYTFTQSVWLFTNNNFTELSEVEVTLPVTTLAPSLHQELEVHSRSGQ